MEGSRRDEEDGTELVEQQAAQLRVSCVGAGLQSLLQVPELRSAPEGAVQALCAHGNNIASLEGVERLSSLTDLNLSSNLITATWALQGLSSLRKLDLASNQLQSVDGVSGLPCLQVLLLAHNYIRDVSGLVPTGGGLKLLSRVDLRNNRLEALPEVKCLAGCTALVDLRLQGNPLSLMPGYRQYVAQALGGLGKLDNLPLVEERSPQLFLPGGFLPVAPASPPYTTTTLAPAMDLQPPPHQQHQQQQPQGPAVSPRPSGAAHLGSRVVGGQSAPAAPEAAATAIPAAPGSDSSFREWEREHEHEAQADMPASSGPGAAKPTPRIDTALAGFQRRRAGMRPLGPRNAAADMDQGADHGGAAASSPPIAFMESRLANIERRMNGMLKRQDPQGHEESLAAASPHPAEHWIPRPIDRSRRGGRTALDAACQTIQVGSQVDALENEAAQMRDELQELGLRLQARADEAEGRARQAEAEAAAQLFDQQRELDELHASAEEAQRGLDDWQERAARAEEAEVAAANRVQELEDNLARSAEELKARDERLSDLEHQLLDAEQKHSSQEASAARSADMRIRRLEAEIQKVREDARTEVAALQAQLRAAEEAKLRHDGALKELWQKSSDSVRESEGRERAAVSEAERLRLTLKDRDAQLQAACKAEAELRGEVMQLSSALASAHSSNREHLQAALKTHEEQLRASLAREAEAAEARGRKLGAQEVMAARDEVQKKLSNTEAEFRCCLRDHQAEVARLKEIAGRHAREAEEMRHRAESLSARSKEQDAIVKELSEVVAAQKQRLKDASSSSSEAARRAAEQYREQLQYFKLQVESLRAAGEEASMLKASEQQRQKELKEARERAEALEKQVKEVKAESANSLAAAATRVHEAVEEAEEARREAERAADAVKIKEKMVDSANEWVGELKDTVADLRLQLEEERRRAKDSEAELAEAVEEQARLQAEHAAQQAGFEEATDAAEAARAKAKSAEKELQKKAAELKEKEEMLGYVSEEVERCKRMFDEKEARLRAANESVQHEAEAAIRQRDAAQRQLEEARSRVKELATEADRERARADATAASLEKAEAEVAEARQRVDRVEEEMRTLLRAHEAQKAAGSRKIAALAKALQELQAPE